MTFTDADAGRAALAFDDLLRDDSFWGHLPRHPEALDALRALVPTAWADQAGAAAQDNEHRAHALAEALGLPAPHHRDALSYPDWVRLGAITELAGWVGGSARTCAHSPDPRRPQPIVAVAWRPGRVTCTACELLLDPDDPIADATCDGCGRVTLGPLAGDGIYAGALLVGNLTWRFGACEDCAADFGPDVFPRTPPPDKAPDRTPRPRAGDRRRARRRRAKGSR